MSAESLPSLSFFVDNFAPGYTGSPTSAAVVLSEVTCKPPSGVSILTFLSSPLLFLSTAIEQPTESTQTERRAAQVANLKLRETLIPISPTPVSTDSSHLPFPPHPAAATF